MLSIRVFAVLSTHHESLRDSFSLVTQSNVAGGTVPGALYTPRLSASNADSTLRIVKEQQPSTMTNPNGRLTRQRLGLAISVIEYVVEDDGIEPTTPCLQSRCSPS